MGVLLYILLSRRQPFRRKTSSLEVLKKAITWGQYLAMEGQRWGQVSKTRKELVKSLLRVDPGERLAAVKMLKHAMTWNEEQAMKMKEKQARKTKEDIKRKRRDAPWPGVDCSGLWRNTCIYMKLKNITIWYWSQLMLHGCMASDWIVKSVL